jgi:acyl-coenzyme A thioesterase PaaI-like protein
VTDAGSSAYPPADHLLRRLALELETVDEVRARAYLPRSGLAVVDGRWAPGAMAVAVDVLAGSMVGRALAPDWMATAELALHLTGTALEPAAGDALVADASVVRVGRTTVVVDAVLQRLPGREVLGEAVLTFVRLPRRESNLDISEFPVRPGERNSFARTGWSPGDAAPSLDELLAPAVLDDGSVVVEVTPPLRNSFGAVNGGVVATVAELTARTAAGSRAVVTDLVVHYVGQGRAGPLVAGATELSRPGTAAWRVEVTDVGATGEAGAPRSVVVAHAVTTELPPAPAAGAAVRPTGEPHAGVP